MEVFWSGVAIAIAVAVLLAYRQRQKSSKGIKWPAGPSTLPIIGNMHQVLKDGDVFHVALKKLAQRHGPLMTIWLGSNQPTIIVSDYELAWEVLVSKSPDFAAREYPSVAKQVVATAGFHTIMLSNPGPHWHALRRGFQNWAVGPLRISGQVPLQESDMTQMIKDMKEEASLNKGLIKPFHLIRRASIRLFARLCFGPDFSDKSFEATMDVLVENAMNYSGAAHLLDPFPLARFFPSIKRTIKQTERLKHSIMELIERHLPSLPPPNCYAHFLLSEKFAREVAIFSIFEVFFLGLDSTSSTTMWALTLLVHNQEAQQKLYQEISDNTENGIVKVEEMDKLEYLQAVVKETMRMKPIAPLAVPHRTARDTILKGVLLPERTPVMVNLYALHYDPKLWDEPERFEPERFMATSKDFQAKSGQYSYLPFGGGMRACPAMDVAKQQVSFLVSNLVKAFHWSNPVEGQLPELAEGLTFILAKKNPLEARIVQRSH